MTHDDLVFEALAYRRNVGTSLSDLRKYLQFRELTSHTAEDDLEALRRFEDAGKLVEVSEKWFLTPDGYKQAKGRALKPEWQWEDAWTLLALLYSSREKDLCKLEHIIAAADHINHAIPMLEELHGALNRLASGRLIRTRRGGFVVTERALELLSKVNASVRRRVLDQLDGLRRIMDCPCCGVNLKSVRWRISLDEDMLVQAEEAYREWSAETLKRH